MDPVFLIDFGRDGQSSTYRSAGWSFQENLIVWSLGPQAVLRLPPLGYRARQAISLEIRGFPHINRAAGLNRQRLVLSLNGKPIGTLEFTEECSQTLELPAGSLNSNQPNELVIDQPDARKVPEDAEGDTRSFAFAWKALTLNLAVDARDSEASWSETAGVRPTLLIAGSFQARNLARLLDRTEGVGDRWTVTHVEMEALEATLRAAMEAGTPVALWQQSPVPLAEEFSHDLLEFLRLPFLNLGTLWPFECDDPRVVPEATIFGTHKRFRYRYTDHVALSLVPEAAGMTDAQLFRRYMIASTEAVSRLKPEVVTTELEGRERNCEVRVSADIMTVLPEVSLFNNPHNPRAAAVRLLAKALLARTDLLLPEARGRALQSLARVSRTWIGIGLDTQYPVHPAVADRLGLAWYDEDAPVRWYGNLWTFREYVLRYMRWLPVIS